MATMNANLWPDTATLMNMTDMELAAVFVDAVEHRNEVTALRDEWVRRTHQVARMVEAREYAALKESEPDRLWKRYAA